MQSFNFLHLLGLARSESHYARLLAWLLHPGENHGLGTRFLHTFIREALPEMEELPETVRNVRQEVDLGGRRMDLLVAWPGQALGVEVKLDPFFHAPDPLRQQCELGVAQYGDGFRMIYVPPQPAAFAPPEIQAALQSLGVPVVPWDRVAALIREMLPEAGSDPARDLMSQFADAAEAQSLGAAALTEAAAQGHDVREALLKAINKLGERTFNAEELLPVFVKYSSELWKALTTRLGGETSIGPRAYFAGLLWSLTMGNLPPLRDTGELISGGPEWGHEPLRTFKRMLRDQAPPPSPPVPPKPGPSPRRPRRAPRPGSGS